VPILKWQDKFNLGVGQFDDHHRHLVVLFNSSYDYLLAGEPGEDLGLILEALVDYAIYHFNAEERWMTENRYPKLEEHLEMHSHFKKRVIEIHKEFMNGRKDSSLEILTLLAGWFSNHILVADADFKELPAKA
jgi:hemerythrin